MINNKCQAPPPPSEGCYKHVLGNTRVQQAGWCRDKSECEALAMFNDAAYYGMEYPQGCPTPGHAQCLYLTLEEVRDWGTKVPNDECSTEGAQEGGPYRVYVRKTGPRIIDLSLTNKDCPSGYDKAPTDKRANGDLNEGASPLTFSLSLQPLCHPAPRHHNLTQKRTQPLPVQPGAGGAHIYICVKKSNVGAPITSVMVSKDANCPSGYHKPWHVGSSNGELNQGAGGPDLWLCQSRHRSIAGVDLKPIAEVKVVKKNSCDSGLNHIKTNNGANGDFNQGAGGAGISLCFDTVVPTLCTARSVPRFYLPRVAAS